LTDLFVVTVVLVAARLTYGAGALPYLHGAPLIVLVTTILLAVVAAVAILVIYLRARKRAQEEPAASDAEPELDLLLDDANRKLRTAQHQGPKSLHALPLLYLLGEGSSAKTTIVLRSGLDPELIAGSAPRDGDVSPTSLLNLWFTRRMAILEAGNAIRQNNRLLDRLVARTRPRVYRSRAPVRAAVVCVSAEQFLVGDAPTSSLASARTIGAQLRQISRLLGAALPVYVLVTKLDRVPHFAEYVRNLSQEEAQQVLGTALARTDASAGVYADKMTRSIESALNTLTFALGEFRVEMLFRETEPTRAAGVYEFPREFAKLRKNLAQYLVELCRPSQLNANPYLRGFYFTGVRAVQVDQVVAVAPPPAQTPTPEVGATRIFSPQDIQALSRPAAQPQRVTTRAPQWAFLPRLFPETILGDKSALSGTQQTAPARHFRRTLFTSLALLFAICTTLFAISYSNNVALELKLLNAARALPASNDAGGLPNLSALQALDNLRLSIVQLDGYQQDGPPWTYRFGLYHGGQLIDRARQIYFDRFRPMLLAPAQANFVSYLRSLPNAAAPGADYTAAYNPLKAYLMTTSNPEKTLPSFLTPLLLQFWTRSRPVDPIQSQLARQQFEFYANQLLRRDPYGIVPEGTAVAHARAYLTNLGAKPRIYQDMQTAAEKVSPGVDFNRQYPNSSSSIIEPHFVRGAFTRSGFAFMQDAIQHPERYFQGETWVLGQTAAGAVDTTGVSKKLAEAYTNDYIKEWYAFLSEAKFVNCGPLQQAPEKLTMLAGSESPILEFLYTISANTAVANQQIRDIFQPAQALVDPNVSARFIGPSNKPYVDALASLGGAVNLFNQNPDTAKDQLSTAVSLAKQAVLQTTQPFNVNAQPNTAKIVVGLLNSPIQCIVPPPPPGLPGTMCAMVGKFPFVQLTKTQASRNLTNNEQASLEEVNAMLAPNTGTLWTYYNQNLKQWLVPQGTGYALGPNAEGHVGPAFLSFFNKLARISSALYPSGAPVAGFSFTLRAIPSKGIENATLVVDDQRIPDGSSVQQFKWNAALAHTASLTYNSAEALRRQGTWALFQLVASARVTRTATGVDLIFPVEVSGQTLTFKDGTEEVVHFEISGPGAEVLAPGALPGLPCVTSVVK